MRIASVLVAVALAVLAGAPGGEAAAGSLMCRVEPAQFQLGQPLHWDIHGVDLPQGLPALRQEDFGSDWLLHAQSSSQSRDSKGRLDDSLRITLYPMRSGVLRLPPLAVGDLRCPGQGVAIALHSPGEEGLIIRTRIEPPQPMVGQPVRIELDLGGPGGMTWSPVTMSAANATLREISTLDTSARVHGAAIAVQRHTWAVLPLTAGRLDVRFEHFRGTRFGQLMIYPGLNLVVPVRPMPAYWPSTLAVGPARWRAFAPPRDLQVGQTGVLRARLHIPAIGRRVLERFFASIPVARGLKMYAPRVQMIEDGGSALDQTWQVDWPFRAVTGGTIAYPALRMPYLDPELQAPRLATASWGALRVSDPRLMRMAIGVAGGALLLGALFGLRSALIRWRLARARRQWMGLAIQGHPQGLADAWAQARVANPARLAGTTLRAWLCERARCGLPVDPRHVDLVSQLEHRRYGPRADDG